MPPLSAPATDHARTRMQQRGIAPAAVEALLQFGREHHDKHGAVVLCLDGRARRTLARSGAASAAQLARLRGLYVVLGDGAIVTVGHRVRRLRRR